MEAAAALGAPGGRGRDPPDDLGGRVDAIKSGTFESRADRHLTRSPLVLDEQGWKELNERLRKALSDAETIAAQSAKRLKKSEEEEIPTRLVMMHFEAPSKDEG